VEDESGIGRQNIASVTFLREIVFVGTAILETERGLGTSRTGVRILSENVRRILDL
jgi:hypothetical protein